MTDSDEQQRLRRQLRATAAVNRQLRAQLDALEAESVARGPDVLQDPPPKPPPIGGASRRGRQAAEWLEPLGPPDAERPEAARPFLVTRPDTSLHLIDGGQRRRIRSGVIVPALEQLLGERTEATDEQFAGWPEGPPVEVLEGSTGPAFLVVGGRRLALRGLPLPHGVEAEVVDRLPEGPTLDVVASLSPSRATTASGWLARLSAGGTTEAGLVVREEDGRMYLVERSTVRLVRSGLLARVLEHYLGEPRPVAEEEFATWSEGLTVELLEGRVGPPFVVVGGRRRPVIGMPLPHPVVQSSADRLPEGSPFDVNEATAPPPPPVEEPSHNPVARARRGAQRLIGSPPARDS